jgi:amino acid permease
MISLLWTLYIVISIIVTCVTIGIDVKDRYTDITVFTLLVYLGMLAFSIVIAPFMLFAWLGMWLDTLVVVKRRRKW